MPPHNVAVTLAYATDSEGWNIEKEQNEGPRTLWETRSPLKYGWQWNTFCLYMCQVWLWSTKWGRAKPDRVLPRECTSHSKHPLPTTQEKTLHMDITRWSTPNQIDYILCSQRWRNSIESAKTTPGADCGSDHELFIGKFRLKLKKVGKTTRPFRYDLNQISYDYTVEVTKIQRIRSDRQSTWRIWIEVHDIVQEAVIKTVPKKKKCKKAKWLSEEALQIAGEEEKLKAKEKRKDTPI